MSDDLFDRMLREENGLKSERIRQLEAKLAKAIEALKAAPDCLNIMTIFSGEDVCTPILYFAGRETHPGKMHAIQCDEYRRLRKEVLGET